MTTELFIPIKFRTTVILTPNEINKDFENTILSKLKLNYENICSKYGYIKKDTIKIMKRSVGQFKKEHFNANIYFDVICIAEICNPAQGSIIKCKVKAKNSLGILAEGYYDNIPILEIIIPKISAGIQSEVNIETININDEISIEVCGKKYQLFDKHISIIGRAIKNKKEFIKNSIVSDNIDEDGNININEDGDEIEEIYVESDKDEEEDNDIVSLKHKIKGGDEEDDEEEDEEEEQDEFEDMDDEFDGGECADDIIIDGGDDEY
jgi:DNA-directed RNA polymerase subunit E'/Rpb7